MFSKQTQWIATALIGVPLAVAGCGGGGNSSPRATPIAAPAVFNISATITQASGGSPRVEKYTSGTASTSTQLGYNVIGAEIGNGINPAYIISVGKTSLIKSGDSFSLSQGNISSNIDFYSQKTVYYTDLSNPSNFDQLASTSGTLKINSLVNHAAVGAQRATTTVSFTLSNVKLVSLNSPDKSESTLNATGQFTAQNFGVVIEPTPIPIPTPFPGPTPLPLTPSVRLDVALSNREKVTFPANLHLTQGTGSTYNRLGADTQNVIFDDPVSTYSFRVNVSRFGPPLKAGDSVQFPLFSIGDNAVIVYKPGQNLAYSSTGGTYKLNSLVKKPATLTSRATTSATFTLSDVKMVGPSSDDPSMPDGRFTLNGTGSFTVEDTGPQ